MITIGDAIVSINSSAEYKVEKSQTDVDAAVITWLNGTSEITTSALKTKMTELQTAYNSVEYQRKRKAEYPAIEDQLDDLYHNGIDGWKNTIKAIKDKYPK